MGGTLRTAPRSVLSLTALTLLALRGCVAAPAGAEPRPAGSPAPHTIVGKLEIVTGIASKALPEPRRALVLLPEGYDGTQRYPVVYATDGQDLFDAATASGGEELGLDELLAAHPEGIPPLIVVGVERSAQAIREYAPPGTVDGGRGDDYLQLVAQVVKPLVEHRYATLPGPRNAVLFGAGAGALLAVYGAWTHPEIFGGAIAIDLPELDSKAIPPADKRPRGVARPRLWISVLGGDVAQRPSAAATLDTLRRGSHLAYLVRSPHTPPIVAAAAGLRSVFTP